MEKFKVTFKYAENIYCANIAVGTVEKIKEYYSGKYEWVSVDPASDYDVMQAEKRGMPIITVE